MKREVDRIECPPGTDAGYIYYKCGCYAIGVGATGKVYTDECKEGHGIGGPDE